MIEIWKNIVDYEGLYQVSNFGRVKSLPRMTATGMRGGRILTPRKSSNGYLNVTLYKDGKEKCCSVHRLVGIAFPDMVNWTEKAKGKPFEELQINHKDENHSNNHVENLEWCDGLYNDNYGTRNERISKATSERLTGVYNTKLSKPVYQYTLDGEFVQEWPSIAEVERQTGLNHGHISQCCNGIRKSAGGFRWSYTPQENHR